MEVVLGAGMRPCASFTGAKLQVGATVQAGATGTLWNVLTAPTPSTARRKKGLAQRSYSGVVYCMQHNVKW